MVDRMIEMERSYLTAEVFREILASTDAIDDQTRASGAKVGIWNKSKGCQCYDGGILISRRNGGYMFPQEAES